MSNLSVELFCYLDTMIASRYLVRPSVNRTALPGLRDTFIVGMF